MHLVDGIPAYYVTYKVWRRFTLICFMSLPAKFVPGNYEGGICCCGVNNFTIKNDYVKKIVMVIE